MGHTAYFVYGNNQRVIYGTGYDNLADLRHECKDPYFEVWQKGNDLFVRRRSWPEIKQIIKEKQEEAIKKVS